MPQYATNGTGNLTPNTALPAVIFPGDEVWLFGTSFVAGQPPTPGIIQAPNDSNVQFEAGAVGEASIAACMAERPGGGAGAGASVLVMLNGNPGIMEVDVQLAPMDADGAYLLPAAAAYKINTWTGPVGPQGYYFAWTELQPLGDQFMRLKVITNPNAVGIAAKVNYI
jgi:hypothetical protein